MVNYLWIAEKIEYFIFIVQIIGKVSVRLRQTFRYSERLTAMSIINYSPDVKCGNNAGVGPEDEDQLRVERLASPHHRWPLEILQARLDCTMQQYGFHT